MEKSTKRLAGMLPGTVHIVGRRVSLIILYRIKKINFILFLKNNKKRKKNGNIPLKK
jgi:hypothetical protein